jgi:hypothetical protein
MRLTSLPAVGVFFKVTGTHPTNPARRVKYRRDCGGDMGIAPQCRRERGGARRQFDFTHRDFPEVVQRVRAMAR